MGFGLETVCVIILAVVAYKQFLIETEDYEEEEEDD